MICIYNVLLQTTGNLRNGRVHKATCVDCSCLLDMIAQAQHASWQGCQPGEP